MEMEFEFEEMEEKEMHETPDAEETDELEEEELSAVMVALMKPPQERSWHESELVDIYRHSRYEAQVAFATDLDTGEALRDENGELVRCSRNTPGAQIPDGFYEDEFGIHIREVKTPTDMKLLMGDMAYQTYKRRKAFGNSDLVFAINQNLSIEQAEEIQDYGSNFLHVEVEYQHK